MTIALVSLAAAVVGTIAVAIFDRPTPPEPIRIPVARPNRRRGTRWTVAQASRALARRLRVASASWTMRWTSSATVGSSSITPTT